jgi:Putative beta-barrel porin 2
MSPSSPFGAGRAILAMLGLALAAPVSAQNQPAQPPARGEMHLGPLTLRPRLDIREAGIDSNIFNEAGDPQQDFTATFTPRLDILMDLGWARARYGTFVDFVYFHEFADERSINAGNEARFEFLLDRFRPYLSGSIVNTRDRMNAELDARAERREWRVEGGTLVALTSRTHMLVAARRGSLEFDEDETFNGVPLARTLNNDSTAYEAGLRLALTPLTTLQVTGAYQRDRFDTALERDTRSWRLTPTLEFDADALVSGRLTLGYTSFEPESPSLEPYRGLTAAGTLAWSVDRTRFEGTIDRDVRYSYEALQPYYLTTGGRLTLTQLIGGPFDVQVRVGRQRLEYRDFAPLDVDSGPRRTDTITTWGGGIGFRLGETARIGVNYEDTARRSPRAERNFDRQRIYGSLAYGF